MSITSKRARAAAFSAMLLGACIQGPWDYYPENPPPYRGVFATVYVLADRPLEQVCFERMLDLAEERTQAFAWYDSAQVEISGPFSGQSRTVALAPADSAPNCFRGDTAYRPERGGEYSLRARFVWDSAGSRAVTVLTGRAQVPESFSIDTLAVAPGTAVRGGIPANLLDLGFLASLPQAVQDTLAAEYGDTLQTLQNDTAGLRKYLEENGPALRVRLTGLLRDYDQQTYREGQTLWYLTGPLNTLSHVFSSRRGEGVGAVLITQRFEKTSGRPETSFDSPLGIEPDSGEFYFPGDIRRLIIYPDATGPNGWNLLDSMGVVNTWFHTGRNRLYFYGFEKAYYEYHSTATGDGAGDSRIKPKYNVQGGNGIMAGAIADSFDVYIRTDSLTKVYPLPAARAFSCRKGDGWRNTADCREFYPEYCRSENWLPPVCGADAIRICLDSAAAADTALGDLCDSVAGPARADTSLERAGVRQYCIRKDFPDDPVCEEPRTACLETKGTNPCKSALWDYCLDHLWKPDACGPGLASYCRDRPRLSETLCRHADAWCAAHADSPLCK